MEILLVFGERHIYTFDRRLMERQKIEIYQEEDSDNEVNHGENSDEDERQEYCFGSVPVSKLQPR